MWFKKKKEDPEIKSWEELIEERGTYNLEWQCRICNTHWTLSVPKRCKPNNKAFLPNFGWYIRDHWNIVDESTGNYYLVGLCTVCRCNEMQPVFRKQVKE